MMMLRYILVTDESEQLECKNIMYYIQLYQCFILMFIVSSRHAS